MRNSHFYSAPIGATILLFFVYPGFSYAIPPPPPPDLEKELKQATFAGVVECLEQGPDVSLFAAVESWYGQAKGELWLGGSYQPGKRYVVLMGPYIVRGSVTAAVRNEVSNSAVGAVWIPRWPSPFADQFMYRRAYEIDDGGSFVGQSPYGKFERVDELKKRVAEFCAEVASGKREREPLTHKRLIVYDYRATEKTVRQHRKEFKRGFDVLGWEGLGTWVDSYLMLCDADPAFVCRVLGNGHFLEMNQHSRGPSYVLTDIFCQTRSSDQIGLVEDLVRSDDAITSMIATMHLYFRSTDVWRERVEAKAAGDDVVATWAALILACDGASAYVDEALNICVADPKSNFSDVSQRYLRTWLLALFNNSAAKADIEPPGVGNLYDDEHAMALITWWTQHKDEIDLVPLTRAPIEPGRVFERLGTVGFGRYSYFGQ
jgi:hypothetical protein